jgi:methylase of polypeptide subunit release factors
MAVPAQGHPRIAGVSTSTIVTAVSDPPLELLITEKAFRPNPTTVRFSRTIEVAPGDVVFDIGTGIGPLAICSAMAGARRVIGVDPVAVHCELARYNVAKYGLDDVVEIHEGAYFEPFEREESLRGLRANVIVGDVSGIADPVARALGWYSDQVPTGGADGADVLVEFLRLAGGYLAEGGWVYFPVAVDLSRSDRVLETARSLFGTVVNAMKRETTQFPMTEDEVEAVDAAYAGDCPEFINIQEGRRRFWRGQIWKAADPLP